jgi:hypothetical protein
MSKQPYRRKILFVQRDLQYGDDSDRIVEIEFGTF